MNTGLLGFPRALAQELKTWLVPSGAGFDFWGPESMIPNGYALPVGQSRSAADFPRLAKLFGVNADGTVTFPDKRGRVSAARDNMGGTAANRLTSGASGINGTLLGASGGAETVSLTGTQNGSHGHGVTDPTHGHGASGSFGTHDQGAGAPSNTATDSRLNSQVGTAGVSVSVSAAATGISIASDGTGAAHQNTQPTIVCNYIIKT